MGKRTTVQDNSPWKPAQPYILDSLAAVGDTFRQNQPALQTAATDFYDAFNRSAPGAETGINLAQGRVNDTLAGRFAGMNPGNATFQSMLGANNPALAGMQRLGDGGFVGQGAGADYFRDVVGGRFVNNNPFLQANIDAAIGDQRNAVNSMFSAAGRFGSEAHQGTMAREAGRISNTMRGADLAAERDRQQQAAGALDGLVRSDRGLQLGALGQQGQLANAEIGIRGEAANALDRNFNMDQGRMDQAIGMGQDLRAGNLGLLGNAAQLPWLGVQAQAGGVTGLSSPYGTRTTTENSGIGGTIAGLGGSLLSAAGAAGGFGALFSEPGMKKNIKPMGMRPDGLGLYEFEYKPETGLPGGRQVGVMADEVQEMRPDALGPTVAGARTVDYGRLGDLSSAMPPPSQSVELPDAKPNFGQRFDRAFGNAVDPNPNRPGAGLSLMGAALMAGSGSPVFGAVGNALLGARQGLAERQDQAQTFDLQGRNADALADWRAAQIMGATDRVGRQPAAVQEWEYFSSLPPEQQREFLKLRRADPLVQVQGEGGAPVYAPRSEAAGQRAPVRAPAAGGGRGGALTANQRANMIAEANAAIARGAPRDAVMARLREMGVQ